MDQKSLWKGNIMDTPNKVILHIHGDSESISEQLQKLGITDDQVIGECIAAVHELGVDYDLAQNKITGVLKPYLTCRTGNLKYQRIL